MKSEFIKSLLLLDARTVEQMFVTRLSGDEFHSIKSAYPGVMDFDPFEGLPFKNIRSSRDATPWTHKREPWQAHRSKKKHKK